MCLFGHTYRVGSGTTWKCCRICGRCRECGIKHDEFKVCAVQEEQPSSLNQPPTSGTSQNPSQWFSLSSLSINGSPISLQPPAPSEKSSESQLQPEPRSVPVVGFRSWNIEPHHRIGIGPGWRLASWNRNLGTWQPGRNKALCMAGAMTRYGLINPVAHDAPSPDCACGFYVLTDFDKVPFQTQEVTRTYQAVGGVPAIERHPITMMVGAVVGWGRVVQHGDEGWRAEKVQVIALLDCKVSDEHLRITREVAESYGVPVVGRKALELLAKEYGDKLS